MRDQTTSTPLPEPSAPVLRRLRPRRRFVIWVVPVAVFLVVALLAVVLLSVRSASPPGASGPGVAFVNSSKGVTAIRVSDGHLLWATSPASFLVQPLSDQGVVFLLKLGDQGLYPVALRATNGTTLWHAETLAGFSPGLTAADGVLYFTAYFRPAGQSNAHNFQPAILALRGSDGHLLWRYDAPASIVSAPNVVDGMVFVGVGTTLVALQGSDGTPRWQVSLPLQQLPGAEQLVAAMVASMRTSRMRF